MNQSSNNLTQVSDHYTSGAYWLEHQNSDSTYKVRLLESLLEKSQLSLSSTLKAAEIGCGQGAFLFPFANYLENQKIQCKLLGYDISSQAILLAKEKNKHSEDTLSFFIGSAENIPDGLDFIFCMDVLEHVENPWELLRSLSSKSKYLILHLPIEQSIGHMLMQSPSHSYKTFRHIHFYSWETAKILFQESPFKLLNYQFTAASNVSLKIAASPMIRLLRLIRYFAYKFNPHLATMLGGGAVLLLLENK
ncbi:class I SAM-dependent methyltransferase [Nostoc sp.]|uniref:class I SAM-dependent methyltransferase n=1 Tax=Nostoc sp. TaxID=1180 RepID=UPI002FFB1FF9